MFAKLELLPDCIGEVQLWCLAGAGGSGTCFARWKRRFGRRIQVLPLELPGHGQRIREKPLDQFAELLECLLASIKPSLGAKFAFYGHSLGGLIATECCRRLESERVGVAEHLFLASSMPPQSPRHQEALLPSSDDRLISYLRDLNGTPDELLNDPEFRDLLLPAFKADLRLLDTYHHVDSPTSRLSCPITVLIGSDDVVARPDVLTHWETQTSAKFVFRTIEGDHFATLRSSHVTNLVETTLLGGQVTAAS
jgi:medium-chain acyl-[acyl-carrier-protein] hydrolase